MNQLYTQINWSLNNFCKAACSYCPSHLWGGSEPRHISEYLIKAKMFIDHYKSLGRIINWSFNGGESLEMFDFPELLKLCKTSGGTIELTTNGGRLWMDWWAIEPYIDNLHLSYHYWQNINLIRYIVQLFRKNNKQFEIIVPIRPDHFDEDFNRALDIEREFNIVVSKSVLYVNADPVGGMLPYTNEQLRLIRGEELIEEKIYFQETTFRERQENKVNSNPSYTGKLCNVGIEVLNINGEGWASGSSCSTLHLGNIWKSNFQLPAGPSKCKMIACINHSDQQITKFDN